jgi:hypothetical protein
MLLLAVLDENAGNGATVGQIAEVLRVSQSFVTA